MPGAAPAGGRTESSDTGSIDRPRAPLPTRVSDTPDLPPEAIAAYDAGLDALGLAGDAVVVAGRDAILGHLRLLLAWTGAVNLTAIRDPVEAVRLHLVDSLAAVRLARQLGADRFVDLGTGGGLPGLPLAVAIPASDALLVDSTAKKAAFVEAALAAVGLAGAEAPIRVAAVRAEALAADPAHRERWPAVVARAIAPLAELVELAFPLLEVGGSLVAWKRGDPASGSLGEELTAARSAMRALGGGELEVEAVAVPGLDGHRLVAVTKRGPTRAEFPRDPAARRRRPPG